jgi:hypothetical protein
MKSDSNINFVKSYLVLIIILSFISCNSNKKENDKERDNLEGNVKSLTEISYTAYDCFGKIEKSIRKRKYDFIYDF